MGRVLGPTNPRAAGVAGKGVRGAGVGPGRAGLPAGGGHCPGAVATPMGQETPVPPMPQ